MENMNTPFQQQLHEILRQGERQAPPGLMDLLRKPIERLIISGAAKHALKEGEQVPNFILPDTLGKDVALADLLAQGPVVIAFYRGAWCPYCNLQLHAYQQILPQIRDLGASLLAISPQTPDKSLTLSEKQALTFPVLSDVGNQVARRFGLVFTLDETVREAYKLVGADLPAYNGSDSWELPIPGTFIVDRSGLVRLAFVDPNFTTRLDPSALLEALQGV